MIPDINIFGKTFSPYMLMALAGILVSLFFVYRLSQKRGLDEIHVLYAMLFSFLGVVIGSHVVYGITNIKYLIKFISDIGKISSFKEFIDGVVAIFGGAVYYGGLIGGIIAAYLYMRHAKIPIGDYSDVCALAIPLFHTFGRIGCFLSGCCYGVEFSGGIVYRHSAIALANGVARFPVQLVEAALNLSLFLILLTLYLKKRAVHKILPLYLLIYPVYRFTLEFLRGDFYRGFWFGLSTSQIISVFIFISAVVFLLCKKLKTVRH